ncbi:MAG TPA: ScyD/ScyE family protein [Candidatus Dormibacteraeota bacterium]
MDHVRRRAFRLLTVLVTTAAVGSLLPAAAVYAAGTTASVFAVGLNNPRGLAFDEGGNLYVAEGGRGGATTTTSSDCEQVAFPIGPYSGAFNASISKITRNGIRTVVASGLPSSQTGPIAGSLVSGVASVVVKDDNELFAMTSGAGCSHGLKGTSNSILRVRRDGTTTVVADLSGFLKAHPVANPDNNAVTGDFEPDGTWYSMVSTGDSFYAVEPNHQELDRITSAGVVSRVVDFSIYFPGNTDWRGPTALARRDGSLYIGTLTPFPLVAGAAQIFKVNPETGSFTVFASGLTSVVGLAFDEHGAIYVLETNAAAGFPGPGNGRVVKIKGSERTVIVGGLNVPTAMAFGPDGKLYISVNGFGAPPGAGQIVRVEVPGED